jgi:FAD-dependent oxidoreductase
VEAGVVIRDLLDVAAKAGLAFPTSTSWDGVSAAGSVSTGAHGSGLVGKGSAINEYVVAMRLVIPAPASEGYAKVIELTEKDEDLKAARFALGTLGAISKITFALQPMFKRSVSLSLEDDADLEDRLEKFLRGHEFADVYWYVAQGKAIMGKVDRAPVDMPGDGLNRASYQPTGMFNVEKSAANCEYTM